jgi:hypothetical protein
MFLTFHFEIHASLDLGHWNFVLETFMFYFWFVRKNWGLITSYHSFPNNWIVPVVLVKGMRKLFFPLFRNGA